MLFNVVEQVVQHPLEVLHVQLHHAVLLQRCVLHPEAGLFQPDDALAQELLHQDGRVVPFGVQIHFRSGKHQKVPEQLVGQFLELPCLFPAGPQITLHLLLGLILLTLQQVQIAHQGGERRAYVMGNGGDQTAVGRPGILLALHPLDDGPPHTLHRPCQIADLVLAVRADLAVTAALFHPLHLSGKANDGAGDAAVVKQIHQDEGQAGQSQRRDDHQIVIGRFRKLHQQHPKHAVGKLQVIIAVFIGRQRYRLLDRHGGQIFAVRRNGGDLQLVAVGLQNGLFSMIDRQIHILFFPDPAFQRSRVHRTQIILFDILAQFPDVSYLPPEAGLLAEVKILQRPAAQHHTHQKDRQGKAKGTKLHHQQFGV